MSDLVAALRATVAGAASARDDVFVLIDQEGGRVARLRPPHWPDYPPGAVFGALADRNMDAACEAVHINARLIAHDLAALGINVDCLPVLDIPQPGAHDIIGDRAFHTDPAIAARLGRAACEGLFEGGVLPVIKHIPGHGRAIEDTHDGLPHVSAAMDELRATDFAPFKALADMPLGMTAHIVFESVDPKAPATDSAKVIDGVIRGEIGFDGVLMSDDLGMGALSGSMGERTKAAQAGGCDLILHCGGDMVEMQDVASHLMPMNETTVKRMDAAFARLAAPTAIDPEALRARRSELLKKSPGE